MRGSIPAFPLRDSRDLPDDGADSSVDTGDSTITFTNGFANEEIEHDSGDILYTESRRPISRASDQTEDIKLIIEF